MRPPLARAVAALLLVGSARATAQAPDAGSVHGVVHGVVLVAGTQTPLPYAAVAIGGGAARFVSAAGAFRFVGVAPGAHRLRVRRIGYRPVDTTVVVAAGVPTALRVHLARLPQELAAVRVAAAGPCRAPGPPKPAEEPELAAVFDQLRLNAEQYALLVATHPFSYAMARTLGERARGGRERVVATDTVVVDPAPAERYAPGRVVRRAADGGVPALALPTLLDLAEPAFQAAHCFFAGGLAEVDGRRVVRIDFRADAALREPDVHGAILLDAASYQIVAMELMLTRVPEGVRNVAAVEVRTRFREVVPGVPVVASVSAENRGRAPGRRPREVPAATERQELVAVRFLGEIPPGAAAPP